MQTEWLLGLAGGVMIGLAAALFLLFNGRIMGASGLLGGLVDGSGSNDRSERIAFLAGLVLVPGAIVAYSGGASTHLTSNYVLIVISGLLVGVGTRLANGCTSGHGVCGISRVSLRGIAATVAYIAAGALTVAALKSFVGIV